MKECRHWHVVKRTFRGPLALGYSDTANLRLSSLGDFSLAIAWMLSVGYCFGFLAPVESTGLCLSHLHPTFLKSNFLPTGLVAAIQARGGGRSFCGT